MSSARHGDADLGFARLRSWALDEAHTIQSVRYHEPQYRNPGELRADVRELLARHDAGVLYPARTTEVEQTRARSEPTGQFRRPRIAAPLIVWEYAMTLERWVINAEERVLAALVAFYNGDAVRCAEFCDTADPSGGLLGQVREGASREHG